ncbi:24021_t:CDS:2, partial [Gigaspora margarita]
DTFDDWNLATKQVEKYATENGFEIYKNSHEHYAKKKANTKDNLTSMCKDHNHPLSNNIQNTGTKFHHLSSKMLEEIEFLVNIGCSTGPIIHGLQKCFPNAIISPKNDQVNKNQIYYESIEVTKDAEFAKDDYESIITNLDSLIKYEAAISIVNKKNLLNSNESVYEHQIEMNYSFLNEIWQTQIISDTVKQNLNCQVKYNQGFGYAKKAVELALETSPENELNKLLQN